MDILSTTRVTKGNTFWSFVTKGWIISIEIYGTRFTRRSLPPTYLPRLHPHGKRVPKPRRCYTGLRRIVCCQFRTNFAPYISHSLCATLPVSPTQCISRSCVSSISVSPLCVPLRVFPAHVSLTPCVSPQYGPPTCVPTRVRPNQCITRSFVSRSVRVPTVCPISCMFHSVCGSPLCVPLGVCPTRYVPDPVCVPLGVCPTQYVSHSVFLPLGVYPTLCVPLGMCPTRYFPLRSDMLCRRNHYMQYVAD